MFEPRTVKTLTALFGAMIVGTLVLMSLNGEPINAPGPHLAALAVDNEMELSAIAQTETTLRKWQGIVVHSSNEGPDIAAKCHFVVEAPATPSPRNPLGISARNAWLQQEPTRHVSSKSGDWNGAIAICFAGDFSRLKPTDVQMVALVKLVNDLQKRFDIPASKVYLYRNIVSNVPADMFPEAQFNDNLRQ